MTQEELVRYQAEKIRVYEDALKAILLNIYGNPIDIADRAMRKFTHSKSCANSSNKNQWQ